MGGQVSKTRNNVTNNITAAVNTTLSATVNASANASCSNIQRIENVECCVINFSEQTCEATAINEVVSSGRLDSAVTQGIAEQISQAAESSTEGIGGIFSKSDASNTVKNTTDIAINTTQTFSTDCSKNATGLNEQSVKDAYCGCGDEAPANRGVDFNFAVQDISLEALGSCVSDIVGSSTSAQDYSSLIGQKATASVTGVSLLELFLAMIGPLMIFIIAPVGFKILTAPRKENPTPAQALQQTGARVRNTSFYFLLFALIVWYPGIVAWYLGAPPFNDRRTSDVDNNVCNPDGTARNDFVVNRFQWYDPNCVSKPAGSPCSDRDQYKSYDTCGIFAKSSFCDDTEFENDRLLFDQMQASCSALTSLYQNGKTSGDIGTLAQGIFKDDQANKSGYDKGCRLCFSNDPGLREKNGLFASIDLEKLGDDEFPECKYSQDTLPASCYLSCDLIDDTAYRAAGLDANGNPILCDPDESEACYTDEQAYLAVSPNECNVAPYQEAKKKLSKQLRAVRSAETVYRTKFPDTPEGPINLGTMCPPQPFDWLDCNGDFSCNYQTQLPESDPNYSFADRACRNDFLDCQDPKYLLDQSGQDAVADDCAKQVQDEKERDEFLDSIPTYSGIAYFVFFFIAVGASVWGSRGSR